MKKKMITILLAALFVCSALPLSGCLRRPNDVPPPVDTIEESEPDNRDKGEFPL